MKRILLAFALAAAGLPVWAQNVGVSVSVSQPGVYGRIDIGHVPVQPVLLYPQPVIIVPGPVAVHQRPIYLHVPPGHAKDWRKHCGKYSACGQPVYFVREDWYQQNYRRDRDDDRDERRGHHDKRDKKHGKGNKHND